MANTHTDSGFKFYSATDYWAELCQRIDATVRDDTVLLMTMTFAPTEPAIARLLQAVTSALSRGVQVRLGIDARSFLTDHGRPGPLWTHGTLAAPMLNSYGRKLDILNALNAYENCKIAILNQPEHRYSLPIAGRSHIKIALINNTIFVGGCNMQGSESIDMMIGWKNKNTAVYLHRTMSEIINIGHTASALGGADAHYQVDQQTNILMDAGIKNQSAIYDQAINLIDSADTWLTITCQFLPNGKTAQHLLMARKRGVKVDVIYGHPSHQGVVGGVGQRLSILRERLRLPRSYFSHQLSKSGPTLHAKLIACDKGMVIGSHNYVEAGVRLGTAEIAMYIENQEVARQALRSFDQALESTRRE